jgi:uncharacterized protein YuzE
MVSVSYDRTAKALYVHLDKGKKIAKTVQVGPGYFMDLAEDKEVFGLETIHPESIPEEAIQPIINRIQPIKILA